jgi:hypothetical protein
MMAGMTTKGVASDMAVERAETGTTHRLILLSNGFAARRAARHEERASEKRGNGTEEGSRETRIT